MSLHNAGKFSPGRPKSVYTRHFVEVRDAMSVKNAGSLSTGRQTLFDIREEHIAERSPMGV